MNFTRAGIIIFSVAALAGPWYTVEGYDTTTNLISQLGAQNTPNNFIMVVGFLALGLGIVADGIRRFSGPAVPFLAFGLFMALAGLLAHKPLSPDVPFNEIFHQAHGMLATLAGIAITAGLIWYGLRAVTVKSRVIAFTLAALCLALPLCMLYFQGAQGLIQRLMYLLMFSWLWVCHPDRVSAREER
jgi:hypothetical membrane protein